MFLRGPAAAGASWKHVPQAKVREVLAGGQGEEQSDQWRRMSRLRVEGRVLHEDEAIVSARRRGERETHGAKAI